jgi:CysZ protein
LLFASLGKAIANFFDGTLKGVVLRAIGLTLVLFALFFIAFEFALVQLPTLGAPWVNHLIELLAPILFVLASVLLGAPVAAVFGAFFLDRVAKTVEARSYPSQPAAQVTDPGTAFGTGARLVAMTLFVNLVLLFLDAEVIPPVPEVLGIAANAWLLGREYFELVAHRHMSRLAAENLRRRNGGTIFIAGAIISLMSSVPVLDLLAPLFGAVFMVHLYKRLNKEGRAA